MNKFQEAKHVLVEEIEKMMQSVGAKLSHKDSERYAEILINRLSDEFLGRADRGSGHDRERDRPVPGTFSREDWDDGRGWPDPDKDPRERRMRQYRY